MEGVGIGVTDEGAASNFKGGEVDFNGVENLEEYRPGGYHPVTPGDVLGGRLVILQIELFFFFLQASLAKINLKFYSGSTTCFGIFL